MSDRSAEQREKFQVDKHKSSAFQKWHLSYYKNGFKIHACNVREIGEQRKCSIQIQIMNGELQLSSTNEQPC